MRFKEWFIENDNFSLLFNPEQQREMLFRMAIEKRLKGKPWKLTMGFSPEEHEEIRKEVEAQLALQQFSRPR